MPGKINQLKYFQEIATWEFSVLIEVQTMSAVKFKYIIRQGVISWIIRKLDYIPLMKGNVLRDICYNLIPDIFWWEQRQRKGEIFDHVSRSCEQYCDCLSFFLKQLHLSIYGCAGSLVLRGLCSSPGEWGCSRCGALASHCASLVAEHRLQGAWASEGVALSAD